MILPTQYQQYIHLSRYARWNEVEGRRETWEETVDRYMDFWISKGGVDKKTAKELRQEILTLGVMPSMRALMTAGEALDRDNVAGYNCAYLAVDSVRAFDECMYILMCGTGVGFSVERQYINKLPEVPEQMEVTDEVIHVTDSKIGWASAYRKLVARLYSGEVPSWNTDKVRAAGERLKTFGGRASGPAPLEDLFKFTVEMFTRVSESGGRRLNSLECHDIMCKIADIVVVGGVRRSALISLSNLTDERMRHAKSGQWWESEGQRALANNSVCYTEKPDVGIFMREWSALYESRSGERGIFNRQAAQKAAGKSGRRDTDRDFGTNPCSEIILRNGQFCNLTEVVVRRGDRYIDLERKVRIATILGTLQSNLTRFRYLRSHWKNNTEEERLLGVSLTGIMDHPVLSGRMFQSDLDDFLQTTAHDNEKLLPEILNDLKEVAIETNKEWAKKLGIPQSVAITCVKPSGTVSQLVDSASGIHPRHSDYYIRTVRADKKDPLAQLMVELGFPVEDDVTKPDHNYVFSFPVKSPEGSVLRNDITALEHLELWKIYQEHWCEHKPSITVYVKEHDWLNVEAWVYENFDDVSGVSFLPFDDHSYRQAPYQPTTKQEYDKLVGEMPALTDWSLLAEREVEDNTTGSQEYACTGGACEIL
jgi:ribonucleoside-triphosphate reductase (thioredoxin)